MRTTAGSKEEWGQDECAHLTPLAVPPGLSEEASAKPLARGRGERSLLNRGTWGENLPFLTSSSCSGSPCSVPQYGVGGEWELLFLWIMIFFSPSFSCLGSACASKILLSPFSRYTWALGGGFCAISSHESMIWVAWLPSYQSTQHELCPILGFPLRTILPQRMASLPHKRF